jgi:hypothetical protein
MTASTLRPGRRRPPVGLLAATSAFLLLATTGAAAVDARGIDRACLGDTAQVQAFLDVTGGAHEPAINCLAAFTITSGTGVVDGQRTYSPGNAVTRQQLASFLQSSLWQVRTTVFTFPEWDPDAPDAFPDVSDLHRFAVNQLADLGIVQGRADGTFGGSREVTRAQVATFVVQAIEEVTDSELPRDAGFADVDGIHAPNVEKLASIGVVTGTGPDTYEPRASLTRAQMASILARSLDHLVEVDALYGLDYSPGTFAQLGLTDVRTGVHQDPDRDRVTFELQGSEELAGWRARYVDEPWSQGSGDDVEVRGDAVIQLDLIGVAFPEDLPPEVEAELPESRRFDPVAVDGAAIVEVVDDAMFEGQQRLFIGTTGDLPFTVGRTMEPNQPQTVYVDVEHPTD